MQKIIFDKKLHKIAIVAPSSKSDDFKILHQVTKLLQKVGFDCKYNENIFSGCALPYFASSKKQSCDDLKNALLDPEIVVIWAIHGGYGSARLVDDLSKITPVGNKILIGFSDITALHMLFSQIFQMPSIHSSGLGVLLDHQKSMLEPIIQVLSGTDQEFDNLKPLNQEAQKNHQINATITGGNLRVIASMIGTKTEINADGKILFFEDVNEIARKIDSDLNQIYRSKNQIFSKAKGLIFGDFTNCLDYEKTIKYFTNEVLPKNIPVFRVDSVGHESKNYPIVIGGNAKILDNKLTIKSPFGLV